MRKRIVPPINPLDRRKWDDAVHESRTFYKRLEEDQVVPEHVRGMRNYIHDGFKENGIMEARKRYLYAVGLFEQGISEKMVSPAAGRGAIENFDGFYNAILKKQKIKMNAKNINK